jgi:hypothetical protein
MRIHRGMELLRKLLPASLVGATLLTAPRLSASALVRMRQAVLETLPGGAVAWSGATGLSFGLGAWIMKKSLLGIVALFVLVGGMAFLWTGTIDSFGSSDGIAQPVGTVAAEAMPGTNEALVPVVAHPESSDRRSLAALVAAKPREGALLVHVENARTGAARPNRPSTVNSPINHTNARR